MAETVVTRTGETRQVGRFKRWLLKGQLKEMEGRTNARAITTRTPGGR